MKTVINKIKNIGITLFSCAFIATSFSSCDSRLDEPVYDFWGDDFFSSTERLNMGVRGIYKNFSNQNVYGQAWMVFDCDTDLSHISGSGIGHLARDLGHYNAYASHSWLESAWGRYYTAIDRANYILEKRDEVVVNGTERDKTLYANYIAESRALRALAYFDLVRLFGDIPYKETYTRYDDDFTAQTRLSAEKVYEHICKELEEAVVDLPWHDEVIGGYSGRFSKGAAHALLARVYLFRGGWSLRQSGKIERASEYIDYYKKAEEHINSILISGKHGLNASYERVFRNMCELQLEPRENMFEFQFYSAAAETANTSVVGTYNGPQIAENSIHGRANSFIKTNRFFQETFGNTDLRKDVAVAIWKIDIKDGIESQNNIDRKQHYNWAPGKWRRTWHTGKALDPNNTNVNWVYIRYADVLLMKAEIENELNGVTSTAIDYINQVKRRGYGHNSLEVSPIDFAQTDFASKDEFLEEIIAERGRELCFEGHRRMDLIRWNKLNDALQTTKDKFDEAFANNTQNRYEYDGATRFTVGKHELYPIPTREILETGSYWKQNPKY